MEGSLVLPVGLAGLRAFRAVVLAAVLALAVIAPAGLATLVVRAEPAALGVLAQLAPASFSALGVNDSDVHRRRAPW